MEMDFSIGLDRDARVISMGRQRILKSSAGTSITLRDYYQRNLFKILKDRWIRDTINYSAPEDIFTHPACQMIIEYGTLLIRYILEDIENSPYRWISVLNIITNENPIPENHIGNVDEMIEDWLEWGRNNGF